MLLPKICFVTRPYPDRDVRVRAFSLPALRKGRDMDGLQDGTQQVGTVKNLAHFPTAP